MGKYSNYTDELFCLPTFVKKNDTIKPSNPFCKINTPFNSSYVDGFFYYLSTKLLEEYNFFNGVKSYGAFVGIKNNFKFKINDDLEYLITNNYFLKNSNKLFQVDDYSKIFSDDEDDDCSRKHTNKKNKINISDHSFLDDTLCDILDISEYNNNSFSQEPILCEEVKSSEILIDDALDFNENGEDIINICENEDGYSNNNSLSDEDCNESESDQTDDAECVSGSDADDDDDDVWITDSEGEEGEDEEEGGEDEESDISEEDVYVTLDKFPVTFIAMEKCIDTLDKLIEKTKTD
jgi:hypothetical protein